MQSAEQLQAGVRTVPSLKGLVNFSYLTQDLRPGLTSIPPLRGWILRKRSNVPTQNEFSETETQVILTTGNWILATDNWLLTTGY